MVIWLISWQVLKWFSFSCSLIRLGFETFSWLTGLFPGFSLSIWSFVLYDWMKNMFGFWAVVQINQRIESPGSENRWLAFFSILWHFNSIITTSDLIKTKPIDRKWWLLKTDLTLMLLLNNADLMIICHFSNAVSTGASTKSLVALCQLTSRLTTPVALGTLPCSQANCLRINKA